MEQGLFKLNDKFLVDINHEWITTIKEFKRIVTRDKDRTKKQAIREFTFIYHALDFRSQFSNYKDEDRIKEAIRNADLPENFNYEKDEDLLIAYKKYEELRVTRSLRIIKGGFKIIDKIEEYFNTVVIADPDSAKKLLDTVNNLGKTISSLKELENQVKRELSEDSGIRGDKEKGDEEDPD